MRASDLRGVAQLATAATRGVATLAEGVHQAVWSTLGAPNHPASKARTRGLTGFVYRTVHGVTELVGQGLQATFPRLEPLLESLVDAPEETPEREAVLAALNGVLGDRMAQTHNPLATPMTLRWQGQSLNPQAMPPLPGATGKVLLMLHGLCMNDLQWRAASQGDDTPFSDHAGALAAHGYTPVFLRYNTGRHISDNGHDLAALLEQVLARWPVPVQELAVVAHSMGGLVMRSAVHTAGQQGLHWPGLLKNLVFLGTPHHGAPLERAGNWVDTVLGVTPFSRPFAKLGQLRSAGITDLRHGCVQEADWQGRDRFRRGPDRRQPLPLPAGVACYTVAATTASQRSLLADRLLGDGLVPLPSALGQHPEARHQLVFDKSHQAILYRTHHMALLHSPAVTQKLLGWLTVP